MKRRSPPDCCLGRVGKCLSNLFAAITAHRACTRVLSTAPFWFTAR